MIEGHSRISEKIVIAITLAALIVGSSIIVQSGIAPKFYDIPIIGLIGYLLSGVIGFWLLFVLLFKKR